MFYLYKHPTTKTQIINSGTKHVNYLNKYYIITTVKMYVKYTIIHIYSCIKLIHFIYLNLF